MNKPVAAADAVADAAAESAAEADEFDAAAADAAAAFGGGTSTHLNEDLSGAAHKQINTIKRARVQASDMNIKIRQPCVCKSIKINALKRKDFRKNHTYEIAKSPHR